MRKIFLKNDVVHIDTNASVAKRYRGRTAIVSHDFGDGRVLVSAPDRVSDLGVRQSDLTRINDI
jgi:hypothetical protein